MFHVYQILLNSGEGEGAESAPPEGKKACVWITTEPCDRVPLDLLQSLYKISWDSLEGLLTQPQEQADAQLSFQSGSLHEILASGE